MEKVTVLRHLKQHIQESLKANNNVSNKIIKLYAELKNVSEEDIFFGDYPKYFYAYMTCNSTGVATSYFEGSKTQRTVALDYCTDQYLFADGHEGAAKKGLEIFHLKQGETVSFYKKSDAEKIAKDYGAKLHIQQFRDLNMSFSSHRLNRYNINIINSPFSYPICPIFVSLIGKEQPILVGYVYRKDEIEYIIIDFKDSSQAPKKHSCCSPWMLLGFIFPPIFIVAIIVIIYRMVSD